MESLESLFFFTCWSINMFFCRYDFLTIAQGGRKRVVKFHENLREGFIPMVQYVSRSRTSVLVIERHVFFGKFQGPLYKWDSDATNPVRSMGMGLGSCHGNGGPTLKRSLEKSPPTSHSWISYQGLSTWSWQILVVFFSGFFSPLKILGPKKTIGWLQRALILCSWFFRFQTLQNKKTERLLIPKRN